ncbi:MAG: bifunctional aspartokinase / homoserine dehydrogenase 1 [Parcubacteria group bacterium Gr01-1014_8]|nr:MAG: bifunctional aspartokinase / homoserine dehydrogenase 1 [Parcubacteria group bacterium Gr01-1014_8]
MSSVRVLKFGGTSVGSPDAIRHIVKIVQQRGKTRIAAIVVSAFSGVTDELIAIGKLAAKKDQSYKGFLAALEARHIDAVKELISRKNQDASIAQVKVLFRFLEGAVQGVSLIHELSSGALDYIMCYGERLSAHIVADVLRDKGIRTEYLNARNIIFTDENFGSASVDFPETNKAINAYFKKHHSVQVVTGFIASTPDGKTTTLGRGGSDYTASILGAALDVDVIEIWTDVSGVMTADPRTVKEAFPIKEMSYTEAIEVSYFGAKVIHPPTMQPAREKNIPILIKNTFEPEAPGTIISSKSADNGALAKSITSIGNVALLRVQGNDMPKIRGVLSRLFGALSKHAINVIVITQASSQHSITIAVLGADADTARKAIDEEFELERRTHRMDRTIVETKLAVIALVGEGMRNKPGVAGRLFQTLGRNGINIVALAQGSSELNISFIVRESDTTKALNAIHTSFFYPRRRDINVFLTGTGLIGGMLLQQLLKQQEFLERERGVRIRVAGIGNQRTMDLVQDGISLSTWKKDLVSSKKRMNIRAFIHEMKKMELPNKVFVDCTASDDIAAAYGDILASGIWVVTPNKKANSGTYKYYEELQQYAAFPGVQFFYETNVGAGLPIVNTLNDLRDSGDKLLKVEAVLSGTLSYIFNNFVEGTRFSDIVRQAKEKGFTEPDPRNDLSGEDVARKILILAREAGYKLELKDVALKGLLGKRFRSADTPKKFFALLEKENTAFEKIRAHAAKKGLRLRYIARLEKGRASVSLEAVPSTHPFYELAESDNIVSFTTERYKRTPLVVKGPGAGAEVTAGGVLADILRIGMTI